MNDNNKKYLEAGAIVGTHGVHGEVKIEPWADSPEFLLQFERFFLAGVGDVGVLSSRIHKGFVIAKLDGYPDVRSAMGLKGCTIFIGRDDAELPPEGYFIADIIGAQVVDENGVLIGILTDILEKPASDVYVISGEREILIPAIPEFILNTDVEAGIITVKLLEGL